MSTNNADEQIAASLFTSLLNLMRSEDGRTAVATRLPRFIAGLVAVTPIEQERKDGLKALCQDVWEEVALFDQFRASLESKEGGMTFQ